MQWSDCTGFRATVAMGWNHYQPPSLDDPSAVAQTQSQTGIQVSTTPDSLFSTAQSTKQNTPSTESLRYALGFQEATHV